ncbi:MAG: motility protein A [Pseudobdellovibrio sp.]
MNISSVLGVVAALLVLIFGIVTSTKTPIVFLDPHGILIVIGGTAAAALMCFPMRFYVHIAKVFWNKFLGNYAIRREIVISEIVDLAKGVRENPDYLKNKVKSIRTPFLRESVELVLQGGFSDDFLDEIMAKRSAILTKRYDQEVGVFRTISKFPPAFGLMGTTLGMIALLQQLGGKDAQKLLGPAMAIGLVATFYGLTLSNLVLIPISENLASLNRDDEALRNIVIDGMKLLRQKEHPKVVEEYLKSYLTQAERTLFGKKK